MHTRRAEELHRFPLSWNQQSISPTDEKMFSHALRRDEGYHQQENVRHIAKASVERYTDPYAQRKILNFAKAFLKYLATTHFDARYQAFELFLEPPKALKERKRVAGRR